MSLFTLPFRHVFSSPPPPRKMWCGAATLHSLLRFRQEFYNQSDREKAEGLPVTPFMDREKVNKAASQCNFISFVLMPLLTAAAELLKELEVGVIFYSHGSVVEVEVRQLLRPLWIGFRGKQRLQQQVTVKMKQSYTKKITR